jgi:hypothetical protein
MYTRCHTRLPNGLNHERAAGAWLMRGTCPGDCQDARQGRGGVGCLQRQHMPQLTATSTPFMTCTANLEPPHLHHTNSHSQTALTQTGPCLGNDNVCQPHTTPALCAAAPMLLHCMAASTAAAHAPWQHQAAELQTWCSDTITRPMHTHCSSNKNKILRGH